MLQAAVAQLVFVGLNFDASRNLMTRELVSLNLETMQPLKPIGLDKWRRVLVSPAAESGLLKNPILKYICICIDVHWGDGPYMLPP